MRITVSIEINGYVITFWIKRDNRHSAK